MGERLVQRKEWQGYIKNAAQEIETVDLVSNTFEPEIDVGTLVSQAPPVHIHPSRAKKRHSKTTRLASLPDTQIGYRNINGNLEAIHDERAIKLARFVVKEAQPDIIVIQGDTIDISELGRYAPTDNHFTGTLQATIDRATQYKAELRADNPNADIYELEGNHEARIGAFVLKNAMAFYGLRRGNTSELPVLTYDFLTRCDDTKTQYVSGYPNSNWQYNDDLLFIHGKEVRSNGSTAEMYTKKYPDINVVFGHVHRHERHTRTTRLGTFTTAVSFGTLARIDGYVPSYNNSVTSKGEVAPMYENWQHGLGIIDDFGSGNFTFDYVPIIGQYAYWQGSRYAN